MVKKTAEPKLQVGCVDPGTGVSCPPWASASADAMREAPGRPQELCVCFQMMSRLWRPFVVSVRGSPPTAPPARPSPGLHGEVCEGTCGGAGRKRERPGGSLPSFCPVSPPGAFGSGGCVSEGTPAGAVPVTFRRDFRACGGWNLRTCASQAPGARLPAEILRVDRVQAVAGWELPCPSRRRDPGRTRQPLPSSVTPSHRCQGSFP